MQNKSSLKSVGSAATTAPTLTTTMNMLPSRLKVFLNIKFSSKRRKIAIQKYASEVPEIPRYLIVNAKNS